MNSMSGDEERRISSLDLLRFTMAIFVIAAHTFALVNMENLVTSVPIISYILRVAVPVFFIVSGFLLFRKMNVSKHEVGNERIWRYFIKIFILYAVFYGLYSIIAWYVALKLGISFREFLGYQIRKFFFVGESAYSWALWYLHGLLLAVLIIWVLLKLFPRMKIWFFPLLAVVIWGIGCIAATLGSERLGNIPGYNTFIFLFERVQRNGIFTGFPFVAIGLYLSQIKRPNNMIGVLFLTFGLGLGFLGIDFGRMLLAIGVVIVALNANLEDRKIYGLLGFMSKWMFLLHMVFIFIYIVLIKGKTDTTMGGSGFGLFVFTLGCSLLSSFLIWIIDEKRSRLNNSNEDTCYKGKKHSTF